MSLRIFITAMPWYSRCLSWFGLVVELNWIRKYGKASSMLEWVSTDCTMAMTVAIAPNHKPQSEQDPSALQLVFSGRRHNQIGLRGCDGRGCWMRSVIRQRAQDLGLTTSSCGRFSAPGFRVPGA